MPEAKLELGQFEGLVCRAAFVRDGHVVFALGDNVQICASVGFIITKAGKFDISAKLAPPPPDCPNHQPVIICQASLDPDGV